MLLRTVWGSLILFVAHANERESEYSEGQRHFPSIPDFPPDSSSNLVLLTHERSYREKVLMVSDLVGNPLGQDEGSSSFLAYSNDDANARIPQDLDGTHFEGDIAGVSLAAVDMLSLGKNENESTVKNAITNTYQRWPGGEIPYVISNSFSRRDRKVIRRAVDQFQAQSCVSWRPRRPSDQNYVHILRDKGCYSSVGRKYGRGGQVLSLGYGCMHLGTVVHEMLHAAGFWHEQSRPDRDSYVAIHWQNIKRGREDNFARYSRGEVSTLQLPYDTASIMHYQSKAFSRNGRATIVAKTKGEVLGQRDGFSPMDLQKLNKLYECDGNESEMTGLTTTTTALVVDPKCTDRLADGMCDDWFRQDACRHFHDYMAEYCPETCGLCQKVISPEECFDRNSRCEAWAAFQDQCSANKDFMTEFCPVTCKACEPTSVRSGAWIPERRAKITAIAIILSTLLAAINT